MTPRLKLRSQLCRIVSIAALSLTSGCGWMEEPDVVTLAGPTMGTQWEISLGLQNSSFKELANTESDRYELVMNTVQAELERINALMSTWDPDSELSRFNANFSTEPIAMNPEIIAVVEQAQRIAKATEGAYDVTRGNVFALWGFSSDEPVEESPSVADLDDALSVSGWDTLSIDKASITKRYADLTLDLSSLAKGYAVDQLGQKLETLGIQHYVVNIGGEIKVRGLRSENVSWQIGIESPNSESNTGLALGDAQLATSGSYRNVRIINGKRISHLIDGRDGQPIAHNLVSATVLHDSVMLADAWSTTFMILGEERAKVIAELAKLPVQLTILREGSESTGSASEFDVWQSPQWATLTAVTIE